MKTSEKGISLMIVFLIMTIMLVMVLSLTVMLFRKITILGDLGSSASAFNSANAGIEKTLYFDRRQIPVGANRGLCNICTACSSDDCQNCQITSLAGGSCDILSCNNCQVDYTSQFDGRSFTVTATITPGAEPLQQNLYIKSQGFYKNTTSMVEFRESK
jgi:hypothetical protein